MGLGDLVGGPPDLDELAEEAVQCWQFCGGWYPERWPVYAALHDVSDWHLLVDAMKVIRSKVE